MSYGHSLRCAAICCGVLLAAQSVYAQNVASDYAAYGGDAGYYQTVPEPITAGDAYAGASYGGYQAPMPMYGGPAPGYMPNYGPMPYGPGYGPGGPECGPGGDLLTGTNVAAPTFYAKVDWLFWKPHRAGHEVPLSQNYSFLDPSAAYDVASTSDLKPDYESGWRTEIGYTLGPGITVSGSYFDNDEWSDSHWVTSGATPGQLNVPFPADLNNLLAVDDFYENRAQWFVYDTQLRSSELSLSTNTAYGNVRHSPLIGFRWFRVGEGLSLRTIDDPDSVDPIGRGAYDEVIKNNLYGAQIGDSFFWRLDQRLAFEGLIKGGFYGNNMKMDKTVLNNGIQRFGGTTSTRAAFSGEANLGMAIFLTQTCVWRVGYTALVIDGVALAPDNFDTLTDLSRPIRDVHGTRFYHGLNVGGEFRF